MGPDAPAVLQNDALYGGQADAGAFKIVAVQTLEGREQLVRVEHIEADAIIADKESRAAVHLNLAYFNNCGIAGTSVLDGIGQQIGEHLAHETIVTYDCRQSIDAPMDGAVCGFRVELFQNFLNEGAQLYITNA
jgi:hypothetical protein